MVPLVPVHSAGADYVGQLPDEPLVVPGLTDPVIAPGQVQRVRERGPAQVNLGRLQRVVSRQ